MRPCAHAPAQTHATGPKMPGAPCKTLGIPRGATGQQIRKASLKPAKSTRPGLAGFLHTRTGAPDCPPPRRHGRPAIMPPLPPASTARKPGT